jgi:SAM-dependent methyltransferase
VNCIVADALRPPFGARSFAVVTSQFGLEYAGPGALAEAARLVAPGGVLAAVLHLRDGGIFRECATNREAIDGFRNSALLPRFDDVYRAAWAVKQSAGAIDALREADRKLAASVKDCEEVLRRFGREVAGGTLYRIYQDVGHMHARLGAYDPGEMATWIEKMGRELDSYAGRMASMLAAALDTSQIARATRELVGAGLGIRLGGVLKFGQPPAPCAWAIVAERDAAAA